MAKLILLNDIFRTASSRVGGWVAGVRSESGEILANAEVGNYHGCLFGVWRSLG